MFEEIEIRLISSLKRNLHRHKTEEAVNDFNWASWQAEKLRNIDNFRKNNAKIVNEYVSVIDDETLQLMQEQFSEGVNNTDEVISDTNLSVQKQRDSPSFFGVNENKMQSLMHDITSIEKHVETAALRTTDDIYRTVVNRVQLEMGTGSMTITQAIDSAAKEFLERGINCIQYSDGRRVNIADYIRMALRTTSTRAMLQGEAKRRFELGYDTVMTSQYSACSETCEPWQGKVYIDDVFTLWDGKTDGVKGISIYSGKEFLLLSTAIHNGLFHPNCRHTLLTYIDGVTLMPEPISADKIRVQRELQAKQRKMENDIRKLKRLSAGTENPDTVKAYRKKLLQAQSELKAFVAQNSNVLKRDYAREKIYGVGKAKKGLTNAVGKPIIEVKKTSITGEPNSITQKVNAKGGVDRNYYDENGNQVKQVSNNSHGHKAEGKLGEHGEHAHDYHFDENGINQHDKARELTEEERKENSDIL